MSIGLTWKQFFLIVAMFWLLGAVNLVAQEPIIENLRHLNTAESQISPCLFGNQLVYLTQPSNGRIDPHSKNIFYEMFVANPDPIVKKKPRHFATELKSSHHEGPLTFSSDQKQIFYTRTNTKHGVVQTDSRGKAGLKIYYAYQGAYEWEGIRELDFNSNDFSCVHPSLAPDGNRIFFASDRPGGFGGLDIYLSEWIDGKWSNPINLGPEVNTSKDEAFPFIHSTGRLFFSSQGLSGYGGWDVFMIDLSGMNWGKVYDLPAPYNSPEDDFGFILDESGNRGYLSSNRPGGMGKDDLYTFTAPRGLENFTGGSSTRELLTVYDSGSSRRLNGADIWLSETVRPGKSTGVPKIVSTPDGQLRLENNRQDAKARDVQELATDVEGKGDLLLKEGKSYHALVFKSGFAPGEIRFDYGKDGPSRPLVVSLQPSNCVLITGTISDQATGNGISGVNISFQPTDCSSGKVSAITDRAGSYYVCIPKGCNYQINARSPGYQEKNSAIGTSHARLDRMETNLTMAPTQQPQQGDVLRTNAVIVLEELDYEGDQFELDSRSTHELDLLLDLLKSQPKLTVALINHTETSGPSAYYKEMSERRVNSIRSYLVARGVADDRLQLQSHGDEVPRNQCGPNVNCSPADHRKNRRTEVRILSTGVRK